MPDFGKALKQLRSVKDAAEPKQEPLRFSLKQQLEFLKSRYTRHRENGGFRRGRLETVSVLPAGDPESTPYGTHYVVRTAYPHDHYHGKVRLDRFSSDELKTLLALMREPFDVPRRDRIIFLDTETTGIQGGTGMCPFLIGVAFFVEDELHVVQYFIRDFDEEPSMLHALGELLSRFDLVITYNGAAFDIPLVETRFTLARLDKPFDHMNHFDLLFTARRLWRHGHGSCRLAALEREIALFDRGPDVPGSMIPRVYFDYLNCGPGSALQGVFVHNVHDVVSLAALTICACDRVTSNPAPLDEALDLYSLARILESSRDWPRSIRMYEMAIENGLPPLIYRKALENLAVVCRRIGNHEKSLEICLKLIREDSFSMTGYEGAAIHYEKVERNLEAARSIVCEALRRLENDPDNCRGYKLMQHRWQRLQQKVISFASLPRSSGFL